MPAKDHLMGKLVDTKRRRVEIEERKALTLEHIASALEIEKNNLKKKNNVNLSLLKASLKLALLFDERKQVRCPQTSFFGVNSLFALSLVMKFFPSMLYYEV